MQLIRFEDACVIKRNTNGYDEYDNPIHSEVYSGACCYQEGGYTNAQRIFMRSPILFLPEISTLIEPNDAIEITTKFGRKLNGVVSQPREVELPITRQRVARLELKQTKE